MKKLLVIVGVLLMVLAFVILGTFIIAPAVIAPLDNAPLLKNFLQGVLCKPGETLTVAYSTYDTPTSTTRSNDMNCVDKTGQPRDVNGQIIGIGLVGYLVPFLGGLFMSMIGGMGNRRQIAGPIVYRNSYQTDMSQLAEGMNVPGFHVKVEPGGNVIVTDKDGKVYSKQLGDNVSHATLTQRLSELKGAFDSGLLTQDEYDAKRKELLKEI